MKKVKSNKVVSFSQYSGYTGSSNNKNKKKEKKKFNFAPLICIIILAIAAGCFCIFTDVFNIEKIDVKGINVAYLSEGLDNIEELEDEVDNKNKATYLAEEGVAYYSIDEVIAISGITVGNNMFKENLNKAVDNLQSAPYIKSASVIRKFPNTIIINIEEREFRAFVDYVGSYACIDNTGFVVNMINKSEKVTDHPCIVGITPSDLVKGFTVGQMLSADDPIKLQRVVNLLNLIDKNHVDLEIETIDVTNVDEVIVKLKGGKIEVNFGDMTNINLKIQFLPEVLKDVGNKRGTILMNSTDDDLQPRFFEKM